MICVKNKLYQSIVLVVENQQYILLPKSEIIFNIEQPTPQMQSLAERGFISISVK